MRKHLKPEDAIHKAVCAYIRSKYPDVIFTSDASGLKLTMGQAVNFKSKKSNHKIPDLLILEPMGVYKGLFIELKAKSVWLKDGTLTKDHHVRVQSEILKRLRAKGYLATFACGFDETKNIIDWYLNTNYQFYPYWTNGMDLFDRLNYLDSI